MGAKETGQSFIAGVLAKLPEAKRAAAQALFEDPEAEAAVSLIGDGVLARTDYSKNMDTLKAKETELAEKQRELTDWYTVNKGALDEYLVIKPEYETLKADPNHRPDPNAKPVGGITEEQMLSVIEQRDRGFAAAMALVVPLANRHQMMFGEVLEVQELLANPKLGRPIDGQPGRVFGLTDAYNEKHGERVTAKATEAESARIKKLVDEGVAERLKGQQQHPFPLRDPNPSPLDALQATDRKTTDFTVDSAVEAYERLQQSRNGAPA